MTRERVIEILNKAFTGRHNSLAGYILHAEPYVAPPDAALLQCIKDIAADDNASMYRVAEAIETLEGIPQSAPYDHGIAEFNYLSLEYLGQMLLRALREEAALCERHLSEVQDTPVAVEALDAVRQMLDRHMANLEALQTVRT